MKSVLESIIEGVLEDVESRQIPISSLREKLSEAVPVRDAYSALGRDQLSLIAEVKRASPSKGSLAEIADPVVLAKEYESGGAQVISVLTEARRFKGSIADFEAVRKSAQIPLLRKDFIVTEYQVIETRVLGADLLLLIVAGLVDSQLRDFYQLATELGMNVLVEVHDEAEIERALSISPRIIGVNSRNLKTLAVDPNAFSRLLPLIPPSILRVAESGISTREQVLEIEKLGGDAILVGESLVTSGNAQDGILRLMGR